jgi:hypothetical protein
MYDKRVDHVQHEIKKNIRNFNGETLRVEYHFRQIETDLIIY